MLWIGLHLPFLSLESFAATLPVELRQMPLALVEARQITHVNASALQLGVKPGMKRATALGRVPQLVTAPADPLRDAQALQSVAHTCLAFTPSVTIHQRGALLEVRASLRYFGSFGRLLQRLRAALAPLGHAVQCASAPTAQGAALLARSPAELHCPDLASLHSVLDTAPMWLFCSGREHWEALRSMGLRSIADLRALPRSGLARRFGEALLDELDRALGERPDPRVWVTLPPRFESRLELFARADTTEQVLHGAATLLARMVAWLSAQHAFARRFTLLMLHEARRSQAVPLPPHSALEIALAAPSRDPAHLLLLLRERLAQVQLAAPTLELRLQAHDVARAPSPNSELFPTVRDEREGLTRLVERLQARLGRRQVQRPVCLHDHRPERSSALQEVDAATMHRQPGRAQPPAVQRLPVTRPVWLVEPPQPLPEQRERPMLDGAPLKLLSGPERIEAGWWDEGLTGRDYFIAQAADASVVWIYRLRLASLDVQHCGWYLHGRFA